MMLGGTNAKASPPQSPSGGLAPDAASAPSAVPSGARPSVPSPDGPPTPEQMLAKARRILADGGDPAVLLRTAIHYRDRWARMLEEQGLRAGTPQRLDGRASIYTGETYAQAYDRWEAYRLLLVAETAGTHGGC